MPVEFHYSACMDNGSLRWQLRGQADLYLKPNPKPINLLAAESKDKREDALESCCHHREPASLGK